MLSLLERAERSILLGHLSEAHSLLDSLRSELSHLGPDSEGQRREFIAAFRRFKATVRKCRQRDQMLAAVYAGNRQEPYHG